MGYYLSTLSTDPKPSYHITKSAQRIMIWPYASYGYYCHDLTEAEKQFEKEIKSSPDSKYQLVKYESVLSNGQVIGITGNEEVIKSYPE